jgi:hypothetical protein
MLSESLVKNSNRQKFDPDGFSKNKPLERDIFYSDPFISCSQCNTISFVDIANLRRSIQMSKVLSDSIKLVPEKLFVCTKCGKTDAFIFGSHDFSKDIIMRIKYVQF